MIFSSHSDATPIATCARYEADRAPIPIEVNGSPLDFDQPHEISLQRRFFSVGNQRVSLERDLMLEVYINAGVVRIKDWGIKLSLYDEAQEIEWDRVILRKFLDLYGKAESGSLDESEREQWGSIIEQVDYQRFCAERAPEIYIEGTYIGQDAKGWNVRLHDGTARQIDLDTGASLRLLEVGERFGAMVRLGNHGSIISMSNISMLADSERIA